LKTDAKTLEVELRSQVRSLHQELENKDHDLQVTIKSLERLRKEKSVHTNGISGMNSL